MAIDINEKFEVPAGLDEVWRFVVEPAQVVTCMPGAELIEQKNENTYLGKVKVKLGAIMASYQGEVVFESIDEASRTLRLVGEGREPGGGTAKGTVDIGLHETASGGTEMRIDVQVDLTGKVMQVGGGMIKPVSKQLSSSSNLPTMPASTWRARRRRGVTHRRHPSCETTTLWP